MFLAEISENSFRGFKNKGFNFNHIAEMNIITTANNLDMSYDFYKEQNMQAVDLKVKRNTSQIPSLINKINRRSRHPSIRKLYYVPIL